MSYRTFLILLLVGGLIPSLLFGLFYRPTKFFSWRSIDLHGLHFVIFLMFLWQLIRIYLGRNNPVMAGMAQWVAAAIFGGLIDVFLWLRLLRFFFHKPFRGDDHFKITTIRASDDHED